MLLCLFALAMLITPLNLLAGDAKADSLKQLIRSQPDLVKRSKLYNNLGSHYIDVGQYDTARKYLDLGLQIARQKKDSVVLARTYLNKGNAYMYQSNYTQALEEYMKSISIREAQKDSLNLPSPYNSIGIVYFRMNDLKKALEYWNKCVSLNTRQKRPDRQMDNYSNLGMLYEQLGEQQKGLDYMLQALQLAESLGEQDKIVIISSNVGEAYVALKNYTKALEYLNKGLNEGGDKQNGGIGSPELLGTLALVYKELKQFGKAHEYYDQAVAAGRKLKSIDALRQLYLGLAELNAAEGKMESAYVNHTLYAQLTDSIFNKQNRDRMSDLKAAFLVEKKEKEIKHAEQEADLKRESEARKQQVIQYALVSGLAGIGLLAFIVFRGNRIKKKSNELIQFQNNEIAEKNTTLGLVNKELTDSINYAKRIQDAILPPLESLRKALPGSFVLFQPRNVVSGDFYFMNDLGNGEVLLAVCDCTGHGVPGAFMSMIGTEQLGKIIQERNVTTPSRILDELHAGLRKTLQQEVNETRDGMDVALCKINLATRQVEYAGANRPLWMLHPGAAQLTEIKADKQPVGGLEGTHRKSFTNHVFQLAAGDRIYLSTDGYADQFGGAKGKKFMVKNFHAFLCQLKEMPLAEQEPALRKQFIAWQGQHEQVDDVLVIGFEL